MSLGNGSKLENLDRLIVKTVLENTIDQLAIVSGTIQHGLTLPQNQLQGPSSSNNVVHWNNTEKTLEEILLKEHKERIAAVSSLEFVYILECRKKNIFCFMQYDIVSKHISPLEKSRQWKQ